MGRINTATLRVKLVYFFYCLGWGAFHPLLSVILEDKGLSKSEIGLLIALYSLTRIVVSPAWSALVDRYPPHAATIFGASAGVAGVSAVGFLYSSDQRISIPLLVVYFVCETGHYPLIDTLTTHFMGKEGGDWGAQRLFGSVGWGLGVPFAGMLYDSDTPVLPLLPACIMSACFGCAYLCIRGPITHRFAEGCPDASAPETDTEGTPFKDALRLFLAPGLAFFTALVTLVNSGVMLVITFSFLYLKDMGASTTLIGLCVATSVVSEVPCFFSAKRVLRKIGAQKVLLLSCASLSLRFVAYMVISSPWQALIVELLHGLTFPLSWTTALAYVNEVAPEGAAAGMVGIMSASVWGLGPLVFTALGGFVYDEVSPDALFGGFAALVLVAALVHALLTRVSPGTFGLACVAGGDVYVNAEVDLSSPSLVEKSDICSNNAHEVV
eukprot:TRINITY_DN745_c0_g1_i6.p1 TRINITY_DN745_c0_g1~~TRINITY_DN745_c0_g1_i6.p1  ORF type:complete len:439 (+),score=141.95 TRINITY_DN745_c0_g1_i6:72-1388(+)